MADASDIEIQIRVARQGDERALADLCVFVQDLHARERPEVFKAADVDGLERWFAELLGATPGRIWIGEVGQEAAGYALVLDQHRPESVFSRARRWFELDQVVVHPAHRRRGVARALFEWVADAAFSEGVESIELNTWAFNQTAQLAFRRLGLGLSNVRLALGLPPGGRGRGIGPEMGRPSSGSTLHRPHVLGSRTAARLVLLDGAQRVLLFLHENAIAGGASGPPQGEAWSRGVAGRSRAARGRRGDRHRCPRARGAVDRKLGTTLRRRGFAPASLLLLAIPRGIGRRRASRGLRLDGGLPLFRGRSTRRFQTP